MATPEAAFKAWFVIQLRKYGAFVQTIETTTGRGVPDLAVLHGGRTCWIELKVGAGSCIVRSEQYAWQWKAYKRGVDVVVIQYNPKSKLLTAYWIGPEGESAQRMASGWKLTKAYATVERSELQKKMHEFL